MMFPAFLYVYAVLLLTFFGLAACSGTGNDTDRLALLEFKSSIRGDPIRILDSWNDTIHFCEWPGITCSRRDERVTVLNLRSSKLSGSISPHLGNLSFLRELNLSVNELSGLIPPQLGYLKRLVILELGNNSLSDTIPSSLFNCSELTYFSLSNNQLEGEIPVEVGLLAKLQTLHLIGNRLTGRIPPSLGNLSSLDFFAVLDNHLHGSIPDSLGHLAKIRTFVVSQNNLSGTIPPRMFNLSTLTTLEVMENQLAGTLPPDLFTTLPDIQRASFGYNLLSGSIPVSLSNASNLWSFQVQDNQFSGTVPSLSRLQRLRWLYIWGNHLGKGGGDDLDFLVNATGLQIVIIQQNFFGGRLPEAISNFSSLMQLDLGVNEISGEIPSGIGNLASLEVLSMQDNRILGIIPSSIGKLQNLVQLYLDRNRLTGRIPSSMGNLTQLTILSLSINFLQGAIPPSIGKLQTLAFLGLAQNNLTGSIPSELFSISSLSIALTLSQNNLAGVMPADVGNLVNLGALDVSDNMLSGDIPASVGDCIRLEQLYMAGNNFQGTIPSSLSSLRGLQALNLSRNNLSGEIPSFLGRPGTLQILNLSYNNFEGAVPVDGIFKNATAVLLEGNDKLCGGSPSLHLPECILKGAKRQKTHHIERSIISTVSAILGVSLLTLLVLLRLRKKKRSQAPSSFPHEPFPAVSYHSLVKATDSFSEANLLGSGGSGSVYKGITGEGAGMMVFAVKVLNLSKRGAVKSFMAECEVLRHIRHRNLVKVLTACSGIDSSGNDFKALVYEFMPNGSLDDWLYPSGPDGGAGEGEEAGDARKSLSLLQRLNIAIDTACALNYLHHQCEKPIVHCDLKPNNILLDADMVAHVGDFGLAKFIPGPTNQLHASQSSSIGVRGSTGYVAPEYGMGSEVSESGDVYSYGIVLLEMFTGKKPTDEMFDERMNLHEFAERALYGGVEEIADPMLLEEGLGTRYDSARASTSHGRGKVMECLVSVFQVGVACSNEQMTERMDIREVAASLGLIKKKLVC